MRTSVTAAVMAASLTIGGAAGATLFVPTLSGAQTDDTTATGDPGTDDPVARDGFLTEALAPLVEDGTITQAQADAVVDAVRAARPERGHGHRHHRGAALTEVLGIEHAELRRALADGQTVAEIAEANGVAVDDVIAALVADARERIDRGVEDGRLTDEEAAEELTRVTERITALVEGQIDAPDHGHRHRRHGGDHGHGPDADAPDRAPDEDQPAGS